MVCVWRLVLAMFACVGKADGFCCWWSATGDPCDCPETSKASNLATSPACVNGGGSWCSQDGGQSAPEDGEQSTEDGEQSAPEDGSSSCACRSIMAGITDEWCQQSDCDPAFAAQCSSACPTAPGATPAPTAKPTAKSTAKPVATPAATPPVAAPNCDASEALAAQSEAARLAAEKERDAAEAARLAAEAALTVAKRERDAAVAARDAAETRATQCESGETGSAGATDVSWCLWEKQGQSLTISTELVSLAEFTVDTKVVDPHDWNAPRPGHPEYVPALKPIAFLSATHPGDDSSAGYSPNSQMPVSLTLTANSNLANVDALSSLTSVGGDLIISKNPSLNSLRGLNALTAIGGGLTISGNAALATLDGGLNALGSVARGITISGSGLVKLDGLTALTSVGSLTISENAALASIDLNTFGKLAKVGGDLSFDNNPSFVSLIWPSALTTLGGKLTIKSNSALTSVTFEAFDFSCSSEFAYTIWGYRPEFAQWGGLVVDDNAALTSIAFSITSVPRCEFFTYDWRAMVVGPARGNLGEQSAVVDYGGHVREQFPGLSITKNPQLYAISMPLLASVEGDLNLKENAALTALPFGSLTSVFGSLIIEGNSGLLSLDGFSALKTVAGSTITIAKNQALKSVRLANLATLGAIGGFYYIQTTDDMMIQGDETAQCWKYTCQNTVCRRSQDGPVVRQAEGGGSLVVENNVAVTEISLPQLTGIGLSLRVQGNDGLVDLSGLAGITSIGVFQSTPFEHCPSKDYWGDPVVFESTRYYAVSRSQVHFWKAAVVDRTRYSYPPATCVGDLDFSLVPGCPTCTQKWRESATRTDRGWCSAPIWVTRGPRHCGFRPIEVPLDERFICASETETTSDSGGGDTPSESPPVECTVDRYADGICGVEGQKLGNHFDAVQACGRFAATQGCSHIQWSEDSKNHYWGWDCSCCQAGKEDGTDNTYYKVYSITCGDGGDDGGGSPGSASLEIIIPVVIAAVLLVAAILFLVRNRVVAARQHRRESMPTVGGEGEVQAEA